MKTLDAVAPAPTLAGLSDLARAAGAEIVALAKTGAAAQEKADGSPVTIADERAEALILTGLARLAPDIPCVAEEEAAAGRIPLCRERFFLVDPLDGTREFVAGSAEYTVNIAYVVEGAPILGVVYQPMTGDLFFGGPEGAFFQKCAPATAEPLAAAEAIHVRAGAPGRFAALHSRTSACGTAFLDRIEATARRPMGSSLKFCLIAKGEWDVYPRFGPVSEWDACAGHAVLRAAGGDVVDLTGAPVTYGHAARRYLVEGMVAFGGAEIRAATLAALKAKTDR